MNIPITATNIVLVPAHIAFANPAGKCFKQSVRKTKLKA